MTFSKMLTGRPVGLRPAFGPKLLKTKVKMPLDTRVYGCILDLMAARTDLCAVTTVRLLRTQLVALDTLRPSISGSALVRALLKLYFDGKIPEATQLALEEMQRASADMRSSPKRQLNNEAAA